MLPQRSTAAMSSVADRAVVQDRLDITLALASALFTVTAVVQLTADPARAVWIPSVVALVTAAVFAIGCVLVRGRHGQFLLRRPTLWSGGVAALVGINPFAYMLATGITYPAIGALLTIVAIAALFPAWRVAAAIIVAVNVCWLVTALAIPPGPGLPTLLVQMAKADALAAMIMLTWERTRSRVAGANELVRQLAVVDDLTGLPNRRGLIERATELIDDARRTGGSVGVGFVDIDGLKSVNDQAGHAAGDDMIRRAAECLATTTVSSGLFVARLAGDEFVVIGAGEPVLRWPDHLAAVRSALARQGISASIGTAIGNGREIDSLDRLLSEADWAMMSDKRSRRSPSATDRDRDQTNPS
ncbi:MAG: GGDEF domain-containing protein [Gordonia paraffinivorans]